MNPVRNFTSQLCRMFVVVATLAFLASLPAYTSDFTSEHFNQVNPSFLATTACHTAFKETPSAGSRCLMGQAINNLVLDNASRIANTRGKKLFGQNFSIVDRLSYSPGRGGFDGELDAVIPLPFFTSFIDSEGKDIESNPGAFFFQHGVTRWTDDNGLLHNDLRYGLVQRFNLSEERGASILGASTFFQQNLEYGHGRVVSGLDYSGIWGSGSFNYFMPTTSWRDPVDSFAYEERAIEGMELSLNLEPTTTLTLETAVTRWEDERNPDRWATGGRVGVKWKPHDWLSIGTAWEGIGARDDSPSFQVSVAVPLDGRNKIPRWKGLGLRSDAKSTPSALWRPVENVGQVRTIKRIAPPVAPTTSKVPQDFSMRFLQDSAGSGDEIKLEVSRQTPAPHDIRLLVRLIPGDGNNPAVPGEDYIEEPVEVTIYKGSTSGVASIQLLRNTHMRKSRTLSATVTPMI